MDNNNFPFTLETVRDYILFKGGKITNHELVKHFKSALTNPQTRDVARNHFKEIVNTIATITRNEDGEKYLVLKKRYRKDMDAAVGSAMNPDTVSLGSTWEDMEPPPYKPPPPPLDHPLPAPAAFANQTAEIRGSPYGSRGSSLSSSLAGSRMGSGHSLVDRDVIDSSPRRESREDDIRRLSRETHEDLRRVSSQVALDELRRIPSTPDDMNRVPTTPQDDLRRASSQEWRSWEQPEPPPVPPRRRSSTPKDDSSPSPLSQSTLRRPRSATDSPAPDKQEQGNVTVSVRERMQKFDKLASESALTDAVKPKKRFEKGSQDRDEEDSSSLNSLQMDPRIREWCVKCSQGDYQAIAKMAAENPKLVRHKNAANGYTALHWAAKHGNADMVKLIAGTYGASVNQRTHGGYTALHIAMQYGNEDVYNLLSQVYGADVNIRDWSGKKARQYLLNKDTTVSADTFRKLKARKKQSEKDHGFLRIGSLNVRVKRTTEAFSNFLGVGHTDKLHKNWGSADNIPMDEDGKKMPPPKGVSLKKRKSKRSQDFGRRSTVTGVTVSTDPAGHDSDSDTAAGFGSTWLAPA